MPRNKAVFDNPNPPDITPFYYATVPTELLVKVEAKRVKHGLTKGALIEKLCRLFLRTKI